MKRSVIFFLMGMFFLCSSVSVAQTADPVAPKPDPAGERMVSLDFDNVDIPVMVKFISELTGKNFVIDEQVRGKVTIFSPVKIPASKAYDVFISVLEMKGFIVVPAGVVYQILPFASYPPSRSMHLYTLQNTVAEEVSQTLTSLVSRASPPMRPKSKPSDEISGPVQIVTEKTTNQLIITASDEDYQIIEKIIKSLDKKKRQVYVEAVVMEMAADKTREIGSDISAIFGGVTNPTPTKGLSVLGTLNGDLGQATALLGTPGVGTTAGTTGLSGVFPKFGLRPINARAFLKALQTSSDVNVLSTPQILTGDRQKAEISVAENVPFKGATNNIAGGAQTVTIERKDVGVILRLTPTVMENSQIKLELYQEISSVIRETTDGPVTAKRSASTTVVVRDRQTAIIGGLLGDSVKVTERKIPLLGDIPILGYLFKFKTKKVEKTNLLIFVTPHIMPDGEDKEASDALLQEKVTGSLKFMNENKLGELTPREEFLKGMINQPK